MQAISSLAILLIGLGVQAQPAAAPPPAGKALLYVYRDANTLGANARPIIFANRDFLTELHRATYVVREVPQGKVVVTASGPGSNFPPALQTSGTGCAGLDWRRLGAAKDVDLAPCESQLRATFEELNKISRTSRWRREDERFRMCESPTRWVAKRGSEGTWVGDCRLAVGMALIALQAAPPDIQWRVEIEVEAGKTYYIKWSLPKGFGGPTMKVVDAASGSKGISGLHLAKD